MLDHVMACIHFRVKKACALVLYIEIGVLQNIGALLTNLLLRLFHNYWRRLEWLRSVHITSCPIIHWRLPLCHLTLLGCHEDCIRFCLLERFTVSIVSEYYFIDSVFLVLWATVLESMLRSFSSPFAILNTSSTQAFWFTLQTCMLNYWLILTLRTDHVVMLIPILVLNNSWQVFHLV